MTTNTPPIFTSTIFNNKAITNFGSTLSSTAATNDFSYSLLALTDGDWIVAGASNSNVALMRYDNNGFLVDTFGSNGKVLTDLSNSDTSARALALTADGKLLVAGYSDIDGNSINDFTLLRYNPDGGLDPTFNANTGRVSTTINNQDSKAYALNIIKDYLDQDKLLVTGATVNSAGGLDFALVRYNLDGTVDESFGTNGIVTLRINQLYGVANSVIIQPDKKIVVAGYSDTGSASNFILARFDSEGVLDTSFGAGNDGIVTQTNDVSLDSVNEVCSTAIQADGKLLVAGSSYKGINQGYDFTLMRYDQFGVLDPTFGTGGVVTTDFNSSTDFARSIIVQHDGKLVVAGYSHNGNYGYDVALARYTTEGNLDISFGNAGKVLTDFGSANDYAYALTEATDNTKLALTGWLENGSAGYDSVLAQYDLSTGKLMAGLTSTPMYIEDSSPIKLDSSVQLMDVYLNSMNNYAGASVSLFRHNGANKTDIFSFDSTGALFTFYDNYLFTLEKIMFASFSILNGTLTISFKDNATEALVNDVLQHISYKNETTPLPEKIQIDWLASDGNTGLQGTGLALSALYSNSVSLVSVNDAPIGQDKTLFTALNTPYTFLLNDFGFTDPNDVPANTLKNVIINSLPAEGSLTYMGNAVVAGDSLSAANINLKQLKYIPSNGFSEKISLSFQVQDDGGVGDAVINPGVDIDSTERFLTINVNATNHAPSGVVVLSGNPFIGETLSVTNTLTDPDGLGAISYRWQANGNTIVTNVRSNKYILTANDVGKAISVIAKYTDGSGIQESVNSLNTLLVAGVPLSKLADVSITGSDLITSEKGDSAKLTVKLSSAPLRDVVIRFTSSDATECIIKTPTLSFTPANWKIAQQLIITGNADTLKDGDVSYVVNAQINTIDVNYKNLPIESIKLTNLDMPYVQPNQYMGDQNGSAKNDILIGSDIADLLKGLLLNDDLSGGKGNDTLYGGNGDDVLFGEQNNDVLSGDEGNDYLDGGSNNDRLYGDTGNDTLLGGDGNDKLFAGLHDDSLDGGAGNDNLNGGAGENTLSGGVGKDTLVCSEGNTVSSGGSGADIFLFNGPLGQYICTINDFNSSEDSIKLENKFFKSLMPKMLSTDNFVNKMGALALDANDYIIYDTNTGKLSYDADGNATTIAPITIATLGITTHPDINANDFLIS